MVNIDYLVPVFGSVSEIARIAGAARSTVSRWQGGKRPIRPIHQRRLLRAAENRDLDIDIEKLAAALDMPKCPYCGRHHIAR